MSPEGEEGFYQRFRFLLPKVELNKTPLLDLRSQAGLFAGLFSFWKLLCVVNSTLSFPEKYPVRNSDQMLGRWGRFSAGDRVSRRLLEGNRSCNLMLN